MRGYEIGPTIAIEVSYNRRTLIAVFPTHTDQPIMTTNLGRKTRGAIMLEGVEKIFPHTAGHNFERRIIIQLTKSTGVARLISYRPTGEERAVMVPNKPFKQYFQIAVAIHICHHRLLIE